MNKICSHSLKRTQVKKTQRGPKLSLPVAKLSHKNSHLALKPRPLQLSLGFLGIGYVGFKLFGPEGPTVRASGFLGKVFCRESTTGGWES